MSDPHATDNPADPAILDCIRKRWSPVCFDGVPVDPATTRSLLEAARWAASCYNDQPWNFLVAPREDREAFDKMLACLVEANRQWAQHAGLLLMIVARVGFRHNGKTNAWASFDCGQATAQLMLQAVPCGLHAHAMAGFDTDRARRDYSLGKLHSPICIVAVGRIGQREEHTEEMRERDAAPNERLDLADIAGRTAIGDISPVVAAPSVAR